MLTDGLIRERIIDGIRDETLMKRLLREQDLTLVKAIDICRATEVSNQRTKEISESRQLENASAQCESSLVHKINKTTNLISYSMEPRTSCGNCGTQHPPRSCPASLVTLVKNRIIMLGCVVQLGFESQK